MKKDNTCEKHIDLHHIGQKKRLKEKRVKKKREDKTKIDVSIIRFALHSLMVW